MDLDLDGNSLADDVDGEPSVINIKYALESWAKRAENLVVFMIDHGGDEQFRLGELELMAASDFAGFFKTASTNIWTKLSFIQGFETFLFNITDFGYW
ncbi:hypothetical protein MTBBW1_1860026 [Desulfamplus magnetovallimortis]|uniref:Uncharacterized protein n=1 Tax=Desulfamplus magnetovallimortis TaxID=1246637 RepID=A0A1W1HAR3_9BACT|nr:hypothetical protein [Desulfamplus magnetovallimortis]SLM29536.1 hypothetical protein MTBBW1_1860026 [Desulfamplus magnetovallimortis]